MYAFPDMLDLSRSHAGLLQVAVFSDGTVLSANAPDIIDGSVTDKYVTGIRRSLSMTVEPGSESWLQWFQLPRMEIVPYLGYTWGQDSFMAPMGVFSVLPPSIAIPRKSPISISADDRWQFVQSDDLDSQIPSYQGNISDVVNQLISEVSLFTSTILLTAKAGLAVPPVIWDKSRHDTIVSLLEPIGCEAFFDRGGQLVIQDRVPASGGTSLSDGERGTITGVTTTQDWSKVANRITVTSSDTKIVFPPATVSITDPLSPAHPWRIGRRTAPRVSSNLYQNYQQALDAATVMLAQLSAPALSWKVTAVPDYSRDAGDLVTVTTAALGTVNAVIQDITHPFRGGDQQITLGAV